MRYKLGDICQIINGRAYKQPELLDAGKYLVLRVGNFFSSDRWYYSDLELPDKNYCNKGDLLYAWACSFGPRIWEGEDRTIFHYHIWKLIPDEKIVDKTYLYYLLKLSTRRLLAGTHGSVMIHITKFDMERSEFELPSLLKQKQIAKVLQGVDRKIAINNRINGCLMEQLLSLVLQNDPDKSVALSEICFYSADRIDCSKINPDTYVSTENLLPNKGGVVRASTIPSTGKAVAYKRGDVLVSNIRPYFRKITRAECDGACSQDVLCFRAKSTSLSALLYATLLQDSFFDYMVGSSKGTKMPRGDKTHIMTFKIPLLTGESLQSFNSIAVPLIDSMEIRSRESYRLLEQRDLLLPKLMSGEIDVGSIEID